MKKCNTYSHGPSLAAPLHRLGLTQLIHPINGQHPEQKLY